MSRRGLLRLDTATTLRRFWHLERALTVTFAAWVPRVGRLDAKSLLARGAWHSSLVAKELRERVFELRYPDRLLAREPDAILIDIYERAIHAPDAARALQTMRTLVAALREAYEAYLFVSDELADGPTLRFLTPAVEEKRQLEAALTEVLHGHTDTAGWAADLGAALRHVGGVGLDPPTVGEARLPRAVPFEIPDAPARDYRYFPCSFYWPDNFDPSYPYGDGPRLQLRTAVSHLNEVWAVDTAGAILYGFARELGWEFILDAARWLYDESRHMRMGEERMLEWGFERSETPLGGYIYEACAGRSPLYRLGMLAFFETKNIGKKAERAETFGAIGDRDSQRDMEFDWADEAIHAGYGRKWLQAAAEATDEDTTWRDVLGTCDRLVADRIARATDEEKQVITEQANRLVEKADVRLSPDGEGVG